MGLFHSHSENKIFWSKFTFVFLFPDPPYHIYLPYLKKNWAYLKEIDLETLNYVETMVTQVLLSTF